MPLTAYIWGSPHDWTWRVENEFSEVREYGISYASKASAMRAAKREWPDIPHVMSPPPPRYVPTFDFNDLLVRLSQAEQGSNELDVYLGVGLMPNGVGMVNPGNGITGSSHDAVKFFDFAAWAKHRDGIAGAKGKIPCPIETGNFNDAMDYARAKMSEGTYYWSYVEVHEEYRWLITAASTPGGQPVFSAKANNIACGIAMICVRHELRKKANLLLDKKRQSSMVNP